MTRFRQTASAVALVLVADLAALPFVGGSSHGANRAAGPGANVAPAPTTTGPPVGTYPLTGLPAYDKATLDRPALSIKVDNAPDARPQVGLGAADLVTEELVEGGLTRLLVTFQSHDAASVGPVRSARPEDAPLLHQLGGGIFAFSGASAGVLSTIRAGSGAVLVQPQAADNVFTRDGTRAAPANLFASTSALYRGGPLGPPPPPLFTHSTAAPSSAGGQVTVTFSGSSSAGWVWDAASGTYHRRQDGGADTLGDGTAVATPNVVVLSVATTSSGNYDVLHHETPLEVLTGTGPCWVLRDGAVTQGQWVRPTAADPVALVGSGGQPIALHPGSAWVELVPHPYLPAITP